jgi:plastocyanin
MALSGVVRPTVIALLAGAVATVGGALEARAQARRAAANVDVQVGLPRDLPRGVSPQSYSTMFFPKAVTIHVGDAVTWHFRNRYGLDTVTFPGRPPRTFYLGNDQGQPIAAARYDAAGFPFWWVGTRRRQIVPQLSFLPQGGDTISSPAQVRSSGIRRSLLASVGTTPAAPYSLRFLKPGVYSYFDIWGDLHAKNTVTVVPPGTPAPSPSEQERAGETQLETVFAVLRTMGRAKPKDPLTVWLGDVRSQGLEIAEVIPSRLVIRRGQVVTFAPHPFGSHTVTIGPPAYTEELRRTLISPEGVTNLVAAGPSEPWDTRQPIAFDGRNHGNGFLSSGCCLPVPGVYATYRVRFTRLGTYHYVDVFHRGMDGVIVVT